MYFFIESSGNLGARWHILEYLERSFQFICLEHKYQGTKAAEFVSEVLTQILLELERQG